MAARLDSSLREIARFSITHGVWRVRVRVLPSAVEMRALWRRLGGAPVRRSEFLHGLFVPSARAPLGTIVLSHADLTVEIVAHEAAHAAVYALRRLHSGRVTIDEGEEYLATLTGHLTKKTMRGLAARGIGCA